jgi:S1-C subfamily serine protease
MHALWQSIFASVISLTFSDASGRITSGSAFKIGNYLVTNNHVIQVPTASQVTLRLVQADGHTTSLEVTLSYHEFRALLVDGEPEQSWDYAVLKLPAEFLGIPSLSFSKTNAIEVGTDVYLFGYQFEQPNLSMHSGAISSQYFRSGVHYIQLDASVNHGNSGGPLVEAKSGQVIGIVTRKATGLTKQFDELHRALQANVRLIGDAVSSGAMIQVGGVNFAQATLSSQVALERLAREVARSANVGIGYAYEATRVRLSISHLA